MIEINLPIEIDCPKTYSPGDIITPRIGDIIIDKSYSWLVLDKKAHYKYFAIRYGKSSLGSAFFWVYDNGFFIF